MPYKNIEDRKKNQREHYLKNKDKLKEQSRIYHKKNKENYKNYYKIYNKKNRLKFNKLQNEYRSKRDNGFYRKYLEMRKRCTHKNSKSFKYYGGRGIKCLWTSYQEFKNDMYESYLKHLEEFGKKNTTLERVDNNGNYEKSNCKWATLKEQMNNTRRTMAKKLSTV